mmetsp:Transcript_11493/g.47812  ORF Transcript_11493/g.47812 Transcript_11493/m.47812 type:complete len:87 (-) Transcript_11493:745-1005(-)
MQGWQATRGDMEGRKAIEVPTLPTVVATGATGGLMVVMEGWDRVIVGTEEDMVWVGWADTEVDMAAIPAMGAAMVECQVWGLVVAE